MSLIPSEILIPVKVGLWWKRNQVGKWLLSKEHRKARRKAKRRLKELGIEEGSALRTSTGAGLAGVLANLLVQVLQMFPATEGLATPEVAAGVTAVVMWAVARIWTTPEQPGAV